MAGRICTPLASKTRCYGGESPDLDKEENIQNMHKVFRGINTFAKLLKKYNKCIVVHSPSLKTRYCGDKVLAAFAFASKRLAAFAFAL